MSGAWTALGSEIWSWTKWTDLPTSDARLLWLALYTSSNAKRGVPGLWQGSVMLMAEESHLPPDVCYAALEALIDAHLVEFDRERKLVRLTELPDAYEGAHNGSAVKGWWNKFRAIPVCEMRNAHVRTLRMLIDKKALLRETPVNHDVEEAWSKTFGTITLPALRRRGVRRLAESDTSTAVQPSLFPVHATVVPTLPGHLLPDVHPSMAGSSASPAPARHPASAPFNASPSASSSEILDLNKIRYSDTLPTPTGTGRGTGSDLLLSSPDPDLSSTLHASTGPPALRLVPDPVLISPEALIALYQCVHKQWRMLPSASRDNLVAALPEAVEQLARLAYTADDIAVGARWVGVRQDNVEVVEIPDVRLLGDPAWLERSIRLGREHERIVDAKRAALADAQRQLGFA